MNAPPGRAASLIVALLLGGCTTSAAQPAQRTENADYLRPYRATVKDLTRLGGCSQLLQTRGDVAGARLLDGFGHDAAHDPDVSLALRGGPALLTRQLEAQGGRADTVPDLLQSMKTNIQRQMIQQLAGDQAGFAHSCAAMRDAIASGGRPYPSLEQRFPANMARLRAAQ